VALILPAYAKLNLTLDVTSRRPNGYHEVDSVMQTVSLHDLVSVERTDCRVFDVVGPVMAGENLVLKAARELEGYTSRALTFSIRLFKRIPLGAGLGGGSADAATFLRAANLLYELNLTPAQLTEIATAVGQDVPFFLGGGTARATGLGSTVSRLPPVPAGWRFLVVCPPVEISTRTVFEAVDGTAATASRTPRLVGALSDPPPRPSPAREEGDAAGLFGNDLEATSRRLFPALDQAMERLQPVLAELTMSGTGAAIFSRVRSAQDAEAALTAARGFGYQAWLCRPVPAWP
jgi:4-diphosphocytidyl-2-C-methyl-D-erythritol kinase